MAHSWPWPSGPTSQAPCARNNLGHVRSLTSKTKIAMLRHSIDLEAYVDRVESPVSEGGGF